MLDTFKLKDKVEETKNELVKLLQDFSQSQVELWRLAPALAREADTLKDFTSGRYRMAYICNLWPLSSQDIQGLCVNLQTGELGPAQLIKRIELGQLSTTLQQLDANKVIRYLKDEIKAT